MKILIVEDEKRLSKSIAEYLSAQGYLCEQAFNFDDAKMRIGVYDYDCILLDLMLPGGSGLDLLRIIRSSNKNTGVIIVSAKESTEDKVEGLRIGADDYLAKPFALPELSMRIYALLRRRDFDTSNILETNGIRIDLMKRTASANGHDLELTKSELELLLFLISNKNRVVSKTAIAEHLSGEMADMLDNLDFIYSHIKNLKAKLAQAGCRDCIKTIYATGYKWIEE
ncbi:MAG: response regulator transcription factor [Prevotella sp.]|jgi:DNA-binding response OmpR family regulator